VLLGTDAGFSVLSTNNLTLQHYRAIKAESGVTEWVNVEAVSESPPSASQAVVQFAHLGSSGLVAVGTLEDASFTYNQGFVFLLNQSEPTHTLVGFVRGAAYGARHLAYMHQRGLLAVGTTRPHSSQDYWLGADGPQDVVTVYNVPKLTIEVLQSGRPMPGQPDRLRQFSQDTGVCHMAGMAVLEPDTLVVACRSYVVLYSVQEDLKLHHVRDVDVGHQILSITSREDNLLLGTADGLGILLTPELEIVRQLEHRCNRQTESCDIIHVGFDLDAVHLVARDGSLSRHRIEPPSPVPPKTKELNEL
jgi:hypothetical protein